MNPPWRPALVLLALPALLCAQRPPSRTGAPVADDLPGAVATLVQALAPALQAAGGGRVGVLAVRRDDGLLNRLGPLLGDRLEQGLHQKGVVLVTRGELEAILKEQLLSRTGQIDDATAAELGNLAGASALVVGHSAEVGRIVLLSVRAVSAKTGQVLAAADVELPRTPEIGGLHRPVAWERQRRARDDDDDDD